MQVSKQFVELREMLLPDDNTAQFTLSMEQVEKFLDNLRTKGRIEDTLKFYRRGLEKFYQDLPENKSGGKSTLAQWRECLIKKESIGWNC